MIISKKPISCSIKFNKQNPSQKATIVGFCVFGTRDLGGSKTLTTFRQPFDILAVTNPAKEFGLPVMGVDQLSRIRS